MGILRQISSYRQISLTFIECKLSEKIVKDCAFEIPPTFRSLQSRHRRTGKIFFWGGGGGGTDTQDDSFVTSSFLRHTVRARAFKIVQIFSVNRDQHF